MKNLIFLSILILGFVSCSGQSTLGTKNHLFAEKANHIVWLQVEGLSPEHLALTGFESEDTKNPLDQFSCLGVMWNYNLYKLRPSANEGFMAQTLGSRNIKRSCGDIDRDPVWSFFQNVGYSVGLFYSQKSSLKDFDYDSCDQNKKITNNAWVWKREKNKVKAPYFHYQEQMLSEKPEVMYDKSCQQKGCGVSFVNHAFNAWKSLKNKKGRTFFVIRDQLYKDFLMKNNLSAAKKRLVDIQDLYELMKKEATDKEISFVVSTSGSIKLDLPKQGAPWKRLVAGKGRVGHLSSSLNSYVWANGPGTENFCGSYNESDMLKRFLWLPDGNFVEDFVLK